MITWWLLFAVGAQPSACVPLEQDQITARALAGAIPAFAKLSPDTPIVPAPLPGARRVLRSFELAALARQHSVDIASPEDLCFECPMESLDRDRVV